MRILFIKEEQRKFLDVVCRKMNKNLRQITIDFSDDLNISYSSMKKYHNEKLLLPLDVANSLTRISNIDWKIFKTEKILPDNWGAIKGGKIGYRKMSKKYSNSLNIWRRKGGKMSSLKNPRFLADKKIKNVKLPEMNEELAEFIGICLGDGTLTRYFIRISSDPRYEIPYLNYISKICKNLFGITPCIRKERERNLIYLTLFSVKICKFLHDIYDLPYGNKIKNDAKIPSIILKNKNLRKSCLRGLIDTDGCVSRGTIYFCSHGRTLKNQVEKIGRELNIFTSSSEFIIGTGVHKKVIQYFKIIGSSNLKHIVRFDKKFKENKYIYVKDVTKFYDEYKNIKLPFRLRVHGLAG